MRGIREEVRWKRAQTARLSDSPSVARTSAPLDSTAIDEVLNSADRVHAIGQNLPPMKRQSGVRRLFAVMTARGFLRLAQIITRDQREFNSSLLLVVRSICDRVRILQDRVTVTEDKTITCVETFETGEKRLKKVQECATSQIATLEDKLVQLEANVADQLEILEGRLVQVPANFTTRMSALEARLAEVHRSLTSRLEALEHRSGEMQMQLESRIERFQRDFSGMQANSYVFDDVTKPGHLVFEASDESTGTATTISYAQNREDVLLARVLSSRKKGFYIDVGAHDPVTFSITKHFYDVGWHGINIEPSSDMFPRLCAARARDINLNFGLSNQEGIVEFYEATKGAGLSTFVRAEKERHAKAGFEFVQRQCKVTTLANICETYVHGEIDFISIDVEGYEREVIEGGDWKKWRPCIVVVEATKPGTTTPSHEDWESLLLKADYLFAMFDGLNRYYIRVEDKHLLPSLSTPVNVFDGYIPYEYLRQIEDLSARIAAYERNEKRQD
jgi:FkbM family methyltransferase